MADTEIDYLQVWILALSTVAIKPISKPCKLPPSSCQKASRADPIQRVFPNLVTTVMLSLELDISRHYLKTSPA